ncbi:MAG: 8-oxoguanine deaminase [FCB group bacterium]|nr:8-oxoguanine deaminase [FCB group bacterium]
MSSILIKNPLVLATMNEHREEFSGGHIYIENGVIKSLGRDEGEHQQADEIIDASGMVVLPGFINTHHHFYQSLTRNIPIMQNAGLFEWLTLHYQLWQELTAEAVHVSTVTAIIELMKSGTTTSSDHLYLFPNNISKELLDVEIESAKKTGIRFQPTRGSMSLGKSKGGLPPDAVVQSEAEIMADTERLIGKYHNDSDGSMVRISLAPCSPFSVTPDLMKHTAEYARINSLMIHTHLAETLDEEEFCLKKFGMRPVEYMKYLGWTSHNAWFAHTVHLNDNEVKLLGEKRCGISHCPSSNMRLGSGIARVKEMAEAGVKVSLSVDGSASNDSGNMLAEARNAMLLSRMREKEYWLTAREVLWFATRGGAAVLGRDDVGQLAVGKRADIAMFSVEGIEYAGSKSDPLASLLFTGRMSPVDYLIIEGKIRIRKGKTGIDEVKLGQVHDRISKEMISRAIKKSEIDFLQIDR